MRMAVQELDRFRDWPDDPTDRAMGPLRFIERQVPVEPAASGLLKTVRIMQVWCFRQFNDEHTRKFTSDHPRGVQRRGETGWFDVPLET